MLNLICVLYILQVKDGFLNIIDRLVLYLWFILGPDLILIVTRLREYLLHDVLLIPIADQSICHLLHEFLGRLDFGRDVPLPLVPSVTNEWWFLAIDFTSRYVRASSITHSSHVPQICVMSSGWELWRP